MLCVCVCVRAASIRQFIRPSRRSRCADAVVVAIVVAATIVGLGSCTVSAVSVWTAWILLI